MNAEHSTGGKWRLVLGSASVMLALGFVFAARDAAAVPVQEKPKGKGAVKGKPNDPPGRGPASPGKRGGGGRPGGGMIQGSLVNVTADGLVLQEGNQQRFVPISSGTEVVLRREADAAALVPGAIVEVNARPDNPQAPPTVTAITVVTGNARPGAGPGGGGPIRAIVVSREPLVISTNGRDKVPLQLTDRTRVAVEVHGGDLRLCQPGDAVTAMLGTTQTARGPLAQRITVTRGGNGEGPADRPKAKDAGKKPAEKKKKDQ